jgi:biopolymer transport protein ExbB
MFALTDVVDGVRQLLHSGGYVLWAIFVLSVLMWTLIVERYWDLRRAHPRRVAQCLNDWQGRDEWQSWYAQRVRDGMIGELGQSLAMRLDLIKTLVFVCPLLGLLGTVTGMIHVFDVMAFAGTGNARAMARGISLATLPTMAGIAVGLSGFYFSARLQQHVRRERQRVADLLGEPEHSPA